MTPHPHPHLHPVRCIGYRIGATGCLGLHASVLLRYLPALSLSLLTLTLPLLLPASVVAATAEPAVKQQFDIPAGEARPMLRQFAAQAKREIVFEVNGVEGISTKAVKGEFSAREALDLMLAETGLVAAADPKSGAIAVRKANGNGAEAKNAPRAAQNGSARPEKDSDAPDSKPLELPTFEVMGSKLLNMDIRRSPDDAQPYVVFGRAALEKSGAPDLDSFIKQQLPMNQVGTSAIQTPSVNGDLSRVNLRGLGLNQTLILVDGRRAANYSFSGGTVQADINGLPLEAIERIEILPTTASGIYGGGATGGVINVILRRDYVGTQLKFTYQNTFSSDTAGLRLNLASSGVFRGGKTTLSLSLTAGDTNDLQLQDRTVAQRYRETIQANNPSFFTSASNPPLGATPNIRSANGSPLFGPGSASFASVSPGYAGGGGLAPLQANAGRYNLQLANSAQTGGGREALWNGPQSGSMIAMIRNEFTPYVDGYLELSGSYRKTTWAEYGNALASSTFVIAATAPNNPFGQDIRVTIPIRLPNEDYVITTQTRRVVTGLIFKLPYDWKGNWDYTWNDQWTKQKTSPSLAAAGTVAIQNGTIDVLRDGMANPVNYTAFLAPFGQYTSPFKTLLRNPSLRLAGPVHAFPAGKATISLLAEHRDENLDAVTSFSPTLAVYFPDRSQKISSISAELHVPIVSEKNAKAGLRELDLQLAGRRDDYTVRGVTSFSLIGPTDPSIQRAVNKSSSTNPTIAIRYRPVASALLRASFAEGFVPPGLGQLAPSAPFASSVPLIDARRGNEVVGAGTYQVQGGGNPNLKPEYSESRSVGAVITPAVLRNLRISVDYTKIKKSNNVSSLSAQQVVDNEANFPDGVIRGALLPGDTASVGRIQLVRQSFFNISEAELEAWDVSVSYERDLPTAGTLKFDMLGSWTRHYKTRALPTLPEIENVGITSNNPSRIKCNYSISWTNKRMSVGWNTRFTSSYFVADPSLASSQLVFLNHGGQRVNAQWYHDAFFSYRFPKQVKEEGFHLRDLIAGLEIQAGVNNIFNKQPPLAGC